MDDGLDPIADDELLYRRVPASIGWYDAATKMLKSEAFGPNKQRDLTGLSVFRGKYKSLEQVARGRAGKSYYVAVLRAGDVRQAGIAVESRPNVAEGYDPAHAELPELNASNYKDSITLERQRVLVRLSLRIEGPFDAPQA